MAIVTVNTKNEFVEKVLEAPVPVLVDFWAAWCGPCKMVAPEVEAVAAEFEGRAVIAKVNVDEQPEIAGKYQIMSIPTLIVFKQGTEVQRIVGFRPRKELAAALERSL